MALTRYGKATRAPVDSGRQLILSSTHFVLHKLNGRDALSVGCRWFGAATLVSKKNIALNHPPLPQQCLNFLPLPQGHGWFL